MREIIRAELNRMTEILRRNGFNLELESPPSSTEITEAEAATGIRFDEGLHALYSFGNGSRGRKCLAVQTCWLAPCSLASLNDSVAWWREWLPYDEKIHRQFWGDGDERGESGRDPRIQPDYFVHRGWFPIAEWNCWSATVYFDADPTSKGQYGQIIAYQHDPDAVHFLASNLGEFLRQSNDRLAANIDELLYCDGRPTF